MRHRQVSITSEVEHVEERVAVGVSRSERGKIEEGLDQSTNGRAVSGNV
jgi:hypothetical protein